MSIIKSNMTAPPPSGGALSSISEMNSLRFDGSSYLSRTPTTAGNQKTWTWSGWVKRGSLGADQSFFAYYNTSSNYSYIRFSSDDSIRIAEIQSSSLTYRIDTTALYRDTSSWSHIIVAADTTQATAADRLKLYVNGSHVTSLASTPSYPSPNLDTLVNITNPHNIGSRASGSMELNGYLANIHFIDGQALAPTAFGEEISGVWVPKAYDPATSGAYGTNGFHLDFADSGNIGNDVSGRNNHWTVN